MRRLRRVAVLLSFAFSAGAVLAASASTALAPAVTASVAVDVSCFGPCGDFVGDVAHANDGGAGAASASAAYVGVHAQTHSSADEVAGAVAVDAAGSLAVPSGAAGNVNVTPLARIDDTITLSAHATLTLRGTISADIASDSASDYVLAKIVVGGQAAVTEEYDGVAAGTRSFSTQVAAPAGTSDFRAELTAHIDLRPSDGQSLQATVKASRLSFVVEVPEGVTGTSGSGRLPMTQGPAPTPSLSANDVRKAEGDAGTTPFSFTVSLSAPSAVQVAVDYATADGTAAAPGDYTSANGRLAFAAGETEKTVTIDVAGDTTVEPDETFELRLSNPAGATIGGGAGTGTIQNDDAVPPPPTACVTVTPSTTVDFGTGALSTPGSVISLRSDKDITITNCGTASETIFVRGTSATATGTTWDLTDGDPCAAGRNRYGLQLSISEASLRVTSASKSLVTLAPGTTVTRRVRILMACSNSDGSGQTLTMQLVFAAGL